MLTACVKSCPFWERVHSSEQVFASNSSSQQVISLIIPHCGSRQNPCLLALLSPRLSLKWNSQDCDVLQVLFCGPKSVIKWFYKTTPTAYVFSRLKPGQTASRFSFFFLRTGRLVKSPSLSSSVLWEKCHCDSVVLECDMGQL